MSFYGKYIICVNHNSLKQQPFSFFSQHTYRGQKHVSQAINNSIKSSESVVKQHLFWYPLTTQQNHKTPIKWNYIKVLIHLQKRSGGLPTPMAKFSRTLCGSWAGKPFCAPHFLVIGNRLHSASMTILEFQQTGSNSCQLAKGGDVETMEEQSRNSSAFSMAE